MGKFVISIYISLVLSVSCLAETEKINDIFNSVVKVKNPISKIVTDYGTGNCINIDDQSIYLITNHHVAGDVGNNISLSFYKDGHESALIPSVVTWTKYVKNQPADISILKVNKTSLNGWTPNIITFDYDDEPLKVGDACLTIGCPKAGWPVANRGHVVKIENGIYYITPVVVSGQSGSVLFNGDGTKAKGLIAWADEEDGYGMAMTAESIQKAVFGKETNYYFNQPYNLKNTFPGIQCSQSEALFGGGRGGRNKPNCPDGDCPNRNPDGGGRKPLLPNTDNPDAAPKPEGGGGNKIFPTAPVKPGEKVPDAPKESLPPSDFDKYKTDTDNKFAGIDDRLSKIESTNKDMLKSIADTPSKSDVVTPGKLSEMEANVDKKLAEYAGSIGKTINEVQKQVADGTITQAQIQELAAPVAQTVVNKAVEGLTKTNDVVTIKSDLEKLNKLYNDVTTKITDVQKSNISNTEKVSETNNTVIKEVLSGQSTDKYITIGGVTIPWFVLALLGYWYRRHFGGASVPPFVPLTAAKK